METRQSLEVGIILMQLFGGLALFLYGMEQMTAAMKAVAGAGMKRLLARLTTNRFKAAFAGAFVTAVIQSSSVTSVLVVGFISAGLLSLQQSIGVIMGANIGTTVTAQIIAFKITQYSLILVTVGFALLFLTKKEKVRQYGLAILGLGLLFFGMELMSEATQPLRTYGPFISLMGHMDNPLYGILVSAAFTGLVQSSSATTGVIIVLASQGFVTLEAGIALAFGANIGTCFTAMLAAIGKTREAVRAAAVHILFNIAGVLIWIAFIDQLAIIVRWISPSAAGLEGTARLAADTPRQIANAHTVFNITNTLLFIWFTVPLARLIARLLPEKKEDDKQRVQPRYLDEVLYQTPVLALDRVRMELRRLGERTYRMVYDALPVMLQGSEEDLLALAERDDEVDTLHKATIDYLGELLKRNLSDEQSALLSKYMAAANNIESIGDLVEINIVEDGLERLKKRVEISPSTRMVLEKLHEKVCWSVQMALQSLDASDKEMAGIVIKAKKDVSRLADEAEHHIRYRLTAELDDRTTLFRLESEIIEYLKRVYYFARRIAKTVV